MRKKFKIILSVVTIGLFSGCIPAPTPQIGVTVGQDSQQSQRVKTPQKEPIKRVDTIDKEYGAKPLNYTSSIRRYFATKIARGNISIYKFSKPKRAYKREGFAYGGAIDWKGWLVETSIATPTRTGRMLTPKPYMVLFSGEQIVDHILGYSHKLITKVDK